jgi:hypothetical protein
MRWSLVSLSAVAGRRRRKAKARKVKGNQGVFSSSSLAYKLRSSMYALRTAPVVTAVCHMLKTKEAWRARVRPRHPFLLLTTSIRLLTRLFLSLPTTSLPYALPSMPDPSQPTFSPTASPTSVTFLPPPSSQPPGPSSSSAAVPVPKSTKPRSKSKGAKDKDGSIRSIGSGTQPGGGDTWKRQQESLGRKRVQTIPSESLSL